MNISEAKKKICFTVTIDLGEFNEEMRGEYVTLKEPDYTAVRTFSKDEDKIMKQMDEIFPSCLVDSSFTDDNGKKAEARVVADVLRSAGSLMIKVLEVWINSCPFGSAKKSDTKSATSEDASSMAETLEQTGN